MGYTYIDGMTRQGMVDYLTKPSSFTGEVIDPARLQAA